MSYWELSDGTAPQTEDNFEMPGGNIAPIPEGSAVKAAIEAVKWQTKKDATEQFIEITWAIMEPEEYSRRKIFHKLWVEDLDPMAKDHDKAIRKRDNARRMMAAIDKNAGGKLMALTGKPTQEQMEKALINKIMVIGLGVYNMRNDDGTFNTGNWVRAISAKSTEVKITDAPLPKASGGATGGFTRDMSDEIPF